MISYTKEFSFQKKKLKNIHGVIALFKGYNYDNTLDKFEEYSTYSASLSDLGLDDTNLPSESELKKIVIDDVDNYHRIAIKKFIRLEYPTSKGEFESKSTKYKQEADELNRKNKLGKYRIKK